MEYIGPLFPDPKRGAVGSHSVETGRPKIWTWRREEREAGIKDEGIDEDDSVNLVR